MARPRVKLQAKLEQLLGTRNVYFQPPESIRLSYPCIIYECSSMKTDYADNEIYRNYKRYKITVITKNPDSDIPDRLAALPYCGLSSHFTVDNLNHDVFYLYF